MSRIAAVTLAAVTSGAVTLSAVLLPASPGCAQQAPTVATGWGVDTTGAVAWTDDARADVVREIFRRWAEYLGGNPRLQAHTKLWSATEQQQWPQYDLTASIAYQGMPPTVLEVSPVAEDRYVVKTLFAAAVGEPPEIKPLALTRVYAVREAGEWVFANALTWLTRDWRRETVGPITYVLEPGYQFDAERAHRAVAFADSLATAYGVPTLAAASYFLTSSPEQLHRIMGVEWTVPGIGYGYTVPWNRQLFSGTPAAGEDYRHELTHYVLAPLTAAGRTHPLVNEGVATWLGGSMGRTFPELMPEYAAYLRKHPAVTLDAVLQNEGPDRGVRPAGATLALMVFEKRGAAGVRDLLGAGRTTPELQAALANLLDMPWAELAKRWRERCLAFGKDLP